MSTWWLVIIIDDEGVDHRVKVLARNKAEAIERGRVEWRDERGLSDDDPKDDGFRMADAIELRR
jgi:hypothetical protein